VTRPITSRSRSVKPSKRSRSSDSPLLLFSPVAIALKRRGDRIQHVLIAKRLGQKIDRAGFHGLDRHGDVAVAGHEYDRNSDVRLGELGLEIEAA